MREKPEGTILPRHRFDGIRQSRVQRRIQTRILDLNPSSSWWNFLLCTLCPEKRGRNVFCNVIYKKFLKNWYIGRFLNKFVAKLWKRFPLHQNNVSTLPCETWNIHRARERYYKKTFCSLFPSHTVYVRDQHPYREHEKWCKLPSMGPGGVPAEMHFSEFGAHETRLVAANVFRFWWTKSENRNSTW